MTEFEDVVAKQMEIMQAEEWGKKVKYLLAQDGKTQIVLNNGDVQWTDSKTGKSYWERKNPKEESLVDKFVRWRSDNSPNRE
jgi:hypothetical protein